MKFNKLGRNVLAAGISAAIALGLTACSRDYTPAYVYSVSSSGGNVNAFAVDYQSGIINQIAGSPFNSTMTNPITVIPNPNNKFLYVIGGSQNSQVETMSIGTDGKLYATQPANMTGTYPTGAAIDSTGTYLYVTYQYQVGFGPNNPGNGGLTVFPIDNDPSSKTYGQLKTGIDVPLGIDPIAVAVTVPVTTSSNAVFVYVAEDSSTTAGSVLELARTSSGALTQVGSIAAGVTPSSIVTEPTGRFVYVADKTSNQIIGYSLAGNGVLSPIKQSLSSTGLYPLGMTVDPRGKYLYVANYNAGSVSGYVINHTDGSLTSIVGLNAFTTGTGPTCVTVDPAVGLFLYTSDRLGGTISGAQLKPEDGTLTTLPISPFPASSLPSCLTSVANGSHSTTIAYP